MQYIRSRQPPHSASLRQGRVSEIGRAYLLTTVVEGRRHLFADWRLGRLVVAEMRAEQDAGRVESLAWVLMPDHLHWLVVLRQGDLETLMRRVKSRSAIAINVSSQTEGRVWQKGYHDHAARMEEDLQGMARYVVANPLRAGLVQSLRDYPLWDAVWLG
jgi:REP element-mobilizing transposase RayT